MSKIKSFFSSPFFKKIGNFFKKVGLAIKNFFTSPNAKKFYATSGKRLSSTGAIKFYSSVGCILLGLIIGLIILVCVSPTKAFSQFGVLITGGIFQIKTATEIQSSLFNIFRKTAPLICCGLCVLFAYKTGLFNIGVAGQYVMGVFASLTFALYFKLPWGVCLLMAALFGAIWASIPGLLKVFCHVNEVISGIMLNWIALFFTNWSLQTYLNKIVNTRIGNKTYSVSGKSLIPYLSIGENKLYISIFIAIVLAIIIFIILEKTTLGYQLKASGLNKDATKYAGMNEKRNVIITMAIAGALAGIGASLFYLTNIESWQAQASESLPGMPWNGIVVAFVAQLNPIGAVIISLLITFIFDGAKSMTQTVFPSEIGDMIVGSIVYLSGLVAFVVSLITRMKMKVKMKKQEELEKGLAEQENPQIEEVKIEGGQENG